MKIEVAKLQPEWSYMNSIRKVRNKLIHTGGVIQYDDPDFPSIQQFSKDRFQVRPINIQKEYEILLDRPEFLNEIIDNISNLIHKITKLEIESI